MRTFLIIAAQDIKLAFKKGSGTANLLAFFIVSATLFPFGIGPESEILQSIGVGVIWVCALLASMLSIPKLFEEDYEDGTLAQLFLQGHLLEITVLSKIFSHWLLSCLPLIAVTPLLAAFFHIEENIWPLLLSLLIGTPTLAAISSIGASLTLGLKRGSSLIAILVLPLYIPVLIFGVAGDTPLLLALLLLMLPISLLACSAAVKMALED